MARLRKKSVSFLRTLPDFRRSLNANLDFVASRVLSKVFLQKKTQASFGVRTRTLVITLTLQFIVSPSPPKKLKFIWSFAVVTGSPVSYGGAPTVALPTMVLRQRLAIRHGHLQGNP